MRLSHLAVASAGAALLTACSASYTITPTRNCSPVIAERPEASAVYPGSAVLGRDAHEGSAYVDAGESGRPWAGQFLAVPAAEPAVRSWYGAWLSDHGWHHVKDQFPTDSTGVKVADVSDWARDDQDFEFAVDISPAARSRYAVAVGDLLVTTQYIAPASDLGCK